ncbi:DUF3592 domain-containing protein [Streptomyces sp. NPDC087512]|uniref:DUF3592 domain-containing protein n=1 Tax=Streptomyces sp. NPDC087512 TaxID=3155059 RepID=UPI0034468D80
MIRRSTAASLSPRPRPGTAPGDRLLLAAAAVYVLVPVFFAVRGADGASYALWLLGPFFGAIGVGTAGAGLRVGRTAYVLRRRGLVAEGRLTGGMDAVIDEHGATVRYHRYSYTDAEGRGHTRSGTAGGEERVEILYDPRDPGRTTKVGRGTTAWLAGAAVLLLVPGLPMLAAGAGLMVSGVVRALG